MIELVFYRLGNRFLICRRRHYYHHYHHHTEESKGKGNGYMTANELETGTRVLIVNLRWSMMAKEWPRDIFFFLDGQIRTEGTIPPPI